MASAMSILEDLTGAYDSAFEPAAASRRVERTELQLQAK
jgi:hypothetical protein